MSGPVLIATPARLLTARALLARHEAVVKVLRYAGSMEHQLYFNEQPVSFERFEPNARARNQLLDRYLRPWHEWVLWLDVDIIEIPDDLLERLMETSEANGCAIVAPMVWIEQVKEGGPSLTNGGWFYDIGGYIDADGHHAEFATGVRGDAQVVEMQSVGCVYLVPAWLYQRGLRYEPKGGQVEHVSFCREARELGTRVLALRDVTVTHAFLPKYGEAWHS